MRATEWLECESRWWSLPFEVEVRVVARPLAVFRALTQTDDDCQQVRT